MRLEAEANEKLANVYQRLLQAGTRSIECIEVCPSFHYFVPIQPILPLDTISAKPVNDKFRSFAKGARLAVNVIQYEPGVERAMNHACGNALVCDTMEVAKYTCWEKGQEVEGGCDSFDGW
ncbi:hypothetical protein BU15DRAFT_57524 [Melanogaster broomeanus]|nr:hypothetical protein BU15DRAFT_57524 [Melanogaster broomeanus]